MANLIEELLVSMIIGVNLIDGSKRWWIYTGDTCHVYHKLSLFKTYNEIMDKNILLRDQHSMKIAGIREVELKFTSRKTLILKDVLHTSEIIMKNLVSGYLLNKTIFAQTIGVYKNNIKFNLEMNKIKSFIYMLCSINVCHARLCHVNKWIISNMSRLEMIPSYPWMNLRNANIVVKLRQQFFFCINLYLGNLSF